MSLPARTICSNEVLPSIFSPVFYEPNDAACDLQWFLLINGGQYPQPGGSNRFTCST
jgi:hypothetical protein